MLSTGSVDDCVVLPKPSGVFRVTERASNMETNEVDLFLINVKVNGVACKALVDTGSGVTLLFSAKKRK
jgi:predicted aspartyl protease